MAGETLGTQFAAHRFDPSALNISLATGYACFRPDPKRTPVNPTTEFRICLKPRFDGFDVHELSP